ncbi:hypothetical protein ALC57_16722 [Trachymyrmex cornetzi]|uniref:Uncharacterized protein n=1 Tax=Trachymyrmex cornetzi TaxID=471704 RepID=A0A195DEB3_9HYME|nr:hypothetical protein ALC57_16722 [Trachymyrmex cornetzi]
MHLLYFLYGFHSQEDTSHPPGNARVKGTRETESKAIIFLFFIDLTFRRAANCGNELTDVSFSGARGRM